MCRALPPDACLYVHRSRLVAGIAKSPFSDEHRRWYKEGQFIYGHHHPLSGREAIRFTDELLCEVARGV